MTARRGPRRRHLHLQQAWRMRTPLLQACLAACLHEYAGTELCVARMEP